MSRNGSSTSRNDGNKRGQRNLKGEKFRVDEHGNLLPPLDGGKKKKKNGMTGDPN